MVGSLKLVGEDKWSPRQFRAALVSYHDAQRYDRPAAAGPAAAGPAGYGAVDPRQRPASLDELLKAFVAQRRMKMSGEYKPCYRVVA